MSPSPEKSWLDYALYYVFELGFSVIPMSLDKRPLIKWKEFQERRPTREEIFSWPRQAIAIITGTISRIAVVDCESYEDAAWFCQEKAASPMVCQSKRGFHFYFRHPGSRVSNDRKVFGRYDVRGDGGYVLAPPSPHSEGFYRWYAGPVNPLNLPVFCEAWRPKRLPAPCALGKRIHSGARYISRIYAVSGQGGHNATFQAALALRRAGLSRDDAYEALAAWNETNADPPWSEAELIHKINDAYRTEDANASR